MSSPGAPFSSARSNSSAECPSLSRTERAAIVSFPDAEAAEDAVEEIIGVNRANDFADFHECRAQFNGNQLLAAESDGELARLAERLRRQAQALAAAAGSRSD